MSSRRTFSPESNPTAWGLIFNFWLYFLIKNYRQNGVIFRKYRISERNSLAQKIFLKTCFSRLFSIIFEKDFSSLGFFSKTKYIVYYMIYNMKPLCIFLICCGFGLVNIYRFIYRSLIFTDFGGGRKSHLCGRFLFSTVEG